jgi:flagellar basal-body rod modification protein FlgD
MADVTIIQPSAAPSAAAQRGGGLGSDFNTFLTLLTTQLRNQDPTKAMSPEQMTAQLVQFAQVEQQIRANASLRELIGLQQGSQLIAAAPLLGRQVEVEGGRLALQGGAATLRLPAAGAVGEATVLIQDGQGRTLREERVALGKEPREWRWDGRDAAGQLLPDGAYGFAVIAGVDAAGAPQALDATALARVTGVERRGGELRLMLGGFDVGFDRVRSLPGG